jgi:hypothetical protein
MSERNYEDECGDHGGRTTDGEPCGLPAGWGTNEDSGRCKHCRGTSPDGSSHENNGNAETHGLTADREKWFERHREDVEPLVRALVESYIEDAPFGFDNDAKTDLLTEVAIDQVRIRKSNETLEEFVTEKVVGQTEDGQPIVTVEENPAHMPRSRIKRDNVRILKELGILDDPDSAQASATETLADVLAEAEE